MSEPMFGLDEDRVRGALERVGSGGSAGDEAGRSANGRSANGGSVQPLETDALAERFARAAWSCIAEPGDGEAGAVLAEHGAAAALTAVIEKWSSERSGRPTAGWRRGLERWTPRLDSNEVFRALSAAASSRSRLLIPGDHLWPGGLQDLGEHAPLALWVRGDQNTLARLGASIAVVGARAATGYGEHVAMESAAGLAGRGLAIVSGAAYGIDGAAHRAALAARGTTIAFLAGGADRLYPGGHIRLLGKIAETGAVLSELPCGAAPTRWRFLQRNRLIAAASSAVVVVEAGLRSGSLNTAGHAAALGRPVGAVPGPVTSPSSAGCHRLLREYGAVCVTGAEEMAELAGWVEGDRAGMPDPERASGSPGNAKAERQGRSKGGCSRAEETRLTDALSPGRPRRVDELVSRSGMSRRETEAALGLLAMSGRAQERDEGWVLSRRPRAGERRVGGGFPGQGE